MKRILSISVFLFSLSVSAQEVSDEVIQSMADWNCKCQDTISTELSKYDIEKQLTNCVSMSYVTFLNQGELPKNFFDDNEMVRFVQKRIISELKNCEKTVQLVNAMDKSPKPLDTVPDNLFITSEFFAKYDLLPGQVGSGMRVWNNKSMDKIQRVVDIRWVFENKEDALKYHQDKLEENSEGGSEVQFKNNNKVAVDLHVFTEAKEMEKMMSSLGISQHHYYFIFVWENVVCKIFVATDGKLKVNDVKFIFEEAVRQLESTK